MLNTSSCAVTEQSTNFITYVYNPLARSTSPWVRVPVSGQAYTVTDPAGKRCSRTRNGNGKLVVETERVRLK